MYGLFNQNSNLIYRISTYDAEDTLWTGTPGNYTDPNAPEVLEEVRKLVDQGDYAEATTAAAKLTGNPAEVCYLA